MRPSGIRKRHAGSNRRAQLRRDVLHREYAMRRALLFNDLVVYEFFVDLRLIPPVYAGCVLQFVVRVFKGGASGCAVLEGVDIVVAARYIQYRAIAGCREACAQL